jgi:hypothetical protein
MTEQDLGIDPKTGKRRPRVPTGDAAQNLKHVPSPHPLTTARDFSRPHTIPADEFEDVTGLSHDDAVREFKANEDKRAADKRAQNADD